MQLSYVLLQTINLFF